MANKETVTTLMVIFENLKYTHKKHEKEAEYLHYWNKSRKLLNILITAGVIILLLLETKHSEWDLIYWGLGATVLGIALQLYEWGFSPDARYQEHRATAKSLVFKRDQLSNLIADAKDNNISVENLKKERDELVRSIHEIYLSAPQTSEESDTKAEKELKKTKK